jgi:hypothetical protein
MYPQDEYCSPIQLWIEERCKGECHLGHEYDVLALLHDDSRLVSKEIQAHMYIMFDCLPILAHYQT